MQAFFLSTPPPHGGQRFCIYHAPAGPTRGVVVQVHAFAEEMNKCRRMGALQSRLLAKSGYAVLQIDLLGCGDSSGDFGDATWAAWLADLAHAANWLRQLHPGAPLTWWGVRAGALLAVQAATQSDQTAGFLFWHPTPSGAVVLQQFLRLKVAAALSQSESKGQLARLKRQLTNGQSVDVAGYVLNPALSDRLNEARLDPPTNTTRGLAWLEMSNQPVPTLLPASEQTLQRWRDAGHAVNARVVAGPAFWTTVEIEDAPGLLDATLLTLVHKEAACT
jgi:uncharacterized protein